MKYISYQLLALFFVFNSSQAQLVNIGVNGIKTNTASLLSIQGEKTFLIDSIKASINDQFNYSFKSTKNYPGIYKLTFNNKKWIDFIYDNEEVELVTNANNILDSLRIIKSESNKIYYNFINLNKEYKTKTELLQLMRLPVIQKKTPTIS